MRVVGKFGVVILGLTLAFAWAYVAHAGCDMDHQAGHDGDKAYSGHDRRVNSFGAMRVDEDLYPFHYGDVNQFGDDEAYNSTRERNVRKVPFPIHREE